MAEPKMYIYSYQYIYTQHMWTVDLKGVTFF